MPAPDPLDQPSGVYVVRRIEGKDVQVEMTFNELHRECLEGDGHMKLWDTLSPDVRFENERANDPNYRPIKPGAGQRKYRPWRGR